MYTFSAIGRAKRLVDGPDHPLRRMAKTPFR